MLTKNDFDASDWTTLRDSLHLVGLATLLAEPSGLGTIKESIAMTTGIMKNQMSEIPLVRDLTSRPEMQAAQDSLRQRFVDLKMSSAKDQVRALALEQARASIDILNGKSGADDINAYKKLIYGLAETVANASREGGFLGFGGKPVSDNEQKFLDDLRDTIQLEQVRKA